MRSMYRLSYRVGGAFKGVVVVEGSSIGPAIERADQELAGWACEAEPINPDEASAIPREFIGRLLDEGEAAELERILVERMPKRPPAPSSVREPARSGKRASA